MRIVRPHWYQRSLFIGFCCLLFFPLLTACEGNHKVISAPSTPTTVTPTTTTNISQSNITKLNTLFTHEALQGNFSGSVLITQNGRLLLQQGYGEADWSQNIPNLADTKFRIGTLAEQFNTLAILLLQDQGKLKVQDAICNYIANCPETWDDISIEQLLTRTSGIEDYTTLADYNETKAVPTTPDQLIARVTNAPAAFKSSTTPTWSATDEVLLGTIIAKASGESYPDYLHHTIFDPLHLHNTGYDQNYPPLPQYAVGYNEPRVPDDFTDISVLYAAGGIYSTVDDLYTFDQALIKHKIGSQATQQAMFSQEYAFCKTGEPCGPDFSEIGIGYGWLIGEEKNSTGVQRLTYYNEGPFEGFSASNWYYPQQKITVIWLSNVQNLPLDIDTSIQNTLFI